MSELLPALKMLYLWNLAVTDGSEWLKDLKPALALKDRKMLAGLGLIEEGKEPRPGGKRTVRAVRVSLTDKGWLYIQEHSEARVNARSYTAGEVLQKLLARLSRYMAVNDVHLAEILAANPAGAEKSASENPVSPVTGTSLEEVRRRILRHWVELAEPGGSVRLAALRARLTDLKREVLDQALLALAGDRFLSLYPFDDPLAVTVEDARSSLTVAGRAMHLVVLQ
ncbi:MAG: hypothetical protein LBP33_13000 [Candidatus Adiutrix sp.]|jgi:hypothetical protein|nr:hypothetical protein [Candidatus Adiutrix sp.]